MAKLMALGLSTTSGLMCTLSSKKHSIYELLSFDFEKFWSGENISILKTEVKPTKLTALEIRAEEHHRKTVKCNVKKKKWTAQLPWLDSKLESHSLTDNLRRVTVVMKKVHDVVLKENMSMVNIATVSYTHLTLPTTPYV